MKRGSPAGRRPWLAALILAGAVILALWLLPRRAVRPGNAGDPPYQPRPAGQLTFARDIAPIIYEHCFPCHRPGQSAPFDLLSYEDVRKRARQIVEVTSSRYMPPWLPDPQYGSFRFERRLTREEMGLLAQWAGEGTQPGDPQTAPAPPSFVEGWHLGKPDLEVRMPEPYLLPAEGRDVYRNFVLPARVPQTRYVSALELQPGPSKALHHAFVFLDTTGQSRRLDAQDEEIGIQGMNTPSTARIPDGQFLSWQPGKIPVPVPPGLAWELPPGADLILQIHMQPTGKPEAIQPALGLFFTDQAPTNAPLVIGLRSFEIDIPAGATHHVVEQSYELPVDVEVLGLLPHAHYLGRDLMGFAVLPDGTRRWLMRIPDWDFNWQGDYQYASPVPLPGGTRLVMRYEYDNSSANVRNPHAPPQRVRYGVETTDEMAELWFQVLTRNREDRAILEQHHRPREIREIMTYNQYRLRQNPGDAQAHCQLGKAYLALGLDGEAYQHLQAAVESAPEFDEAHYYLGLWFRTRHQLDQARESFERAVACNPDHYKAHGNLGLMALQSGQLDRAEQHLGSALRSNPRDAVALDALGLIHEAREQWDLAETQFKAALEADPNFEEAREHWERVREKRREETLK